MRLVVALGACPRLAAGCAKGFHLRQVHRKCRANRHWCLGRFKWGKTLKELSPDAVLVQRCRSVDSWPAFPGSKPGGPVLCLLSFPHRKPCSNLSLRKRVASPSKGSHPIRKCPCRCVRFSSTGGTAEGLPRGVAAAPAYSRDHVENRAVTDDPHEQPGLPSESNSWKQSSNTA